jgi:predicted Fe-Mo cluster-binding NifX family protein
VIRDKGVHDDVELRLAVHLRALSDERGDNERMKIAVATDDGRTVSRHFGRAGQYVVFTFEDGRLVKREWRGKVGHTQFARAPHDPETAGGAHGLGPHAAGRHQRMAEVISDCDALICGGMGYGAYESMRSRGITPTVTDVTSAEEAAIAYAEGRLEDQFDGLH